MYTDLAVLAAAGLTGLGVLCYTALTGWRDWLQLQHAQLNAGVRNAAQAPSINSRIELADLRERIRKLEAIAAGIDP